MLKKLNINKKGDIPSLFYAIVAIAAIGILFLIITTITNRTYSELGSILDKNGYNNSEADIALGKAQAAQAQNIWDYAFLGIAIAYIISMMLLAYRTPTSIVFMIIYIAAASFSFIIGVLLSNAWQTAALNPQLAETIVQFPITNLLLGNFFLVYITIIIGTTIVMLFGKYGGDNAVG